VTQPDALIAAVLPFGADAEILSPPRLREKIRDAYRELLGLYDHRSAV